MGKKNVIILIVSFVALALAGLGLYAWRSAPNAPVLVQLKPRPIIPVQTQIPADWKTYRNEKMKFEIKYPPDWKVDESEGDVVIYKGEKLKIEEGSPIAPYGTSPAFGILERGNHCGDCGIASSQGFLNKLNVNGYYTVGLKNNDSIVSTLWIYSPTKKHVLRIDYGNANATKQKDEKIEKIFNQILSTFRFLE